MALLVVVQTVVALIYRRRLQSPGEGLPDYDLPSVDWRSADLPNLDLRSVDLPNVAVILAVRGPDPKLHQTLRTLLCLDYPRYSIHVVVDSDQDPVHSILEAVRADDTEQKISVSVLQTHYSTCSLKCSALIQATSELASEYPVLAFIDGDSLPHANWLRELVVALQEDTVGVATGNRWYVPSNGNWGSLVRYYWNSAAVVQVWLNGIVWAGSMAMRTEVIERIQLLDHWRHALSVDSTISRILQGTDFQVRFVPGALLVNTEYIRLGSFLTWVRRQMVAAMSSRHGTLGIVSHGLLLAVLQWIPLVLLFWSWLSWRPAVAVWNLATLGIYWGSCFFLAMLLEAAMRDRLKARGEVYPPLQQVGRMRRFLAMLLTNAVYPFILVGALFCRHVDWRGIRYALLPRGKVRMEAYHPYCAPTDTRDSNQPNSVV